MKKIIIFLVLISVALLFNSCDFSFGTDENDPEEHYHSYEMEIIKPTCDEDGIAVYTCAECGHSYSEFYEEAYGHAWDFVDVVVSNCIEEKMLFICSICNEEKFEYSDPTVWHSDFEEMIIAPTCTEAGYVKNICTLCGYEEIVSELSPRHTFGDWIEKEASTCYMHGTKERYCTICNFVESAEAELADHNYVESITFPTCTEGGYSRFRCECGDRYEGAYTDPLGHNFVDGGCTRCDYLEIDDVYVFTLLENDTYEIKAKNVNILPEIVVIPSEYRGKSVTAVGSYGFQFSKMKEIVVPDTITTVCEGAFSQCQNLEYFNFPKNIVFIGEGAFYECSGLKELILPSTVKNICRWTFAHCTSVSKLVIPEGVVSIGESAFVSFSSLISLYIPSSVENITEGAFSSCESLESIKVSSLNTVYKSEGDCLLKDDYLILGCKNSVIPDHVDHIRPYAFSGCIGLTEIHLSYNIVSISHYAFSGCVNLKKVTFENPPPSSFITLGIVSLGDGAFYNCTSLESISLKNVDAVGTFAFFGCTSLTHVYLSKRIHSMEFTYYAFGNCDNLTVYCEITEEDEEFKERYWNTYWHGGIPVVYGCTYEEYLDIISEK
jgi:hypothetical protein